jgi:hypothetical protein
MSQAGFTPIQLYHSTTAAAAPTAGNLANGELSINITDGKLFYKDNLGAVQVLATKAGASGDVVGPASSTDNALVRFDSTTGKLAQNSVAILSDAGALSGLTDISASGAVTLSGGTANGVAYLNASKVLTTGSAFVFDGTNVGIGTSSPQQLLAVGNSTDQFGAGVSGAVTTAYFGTPSNTSGGIKRIAYDRGTGNLTFIGGTVASPSTQMLIGNTGDVGIGTSSPGAKLEVSTSANQSALFKTSAAGSYGTVQIFNTNTNGEASIGYRDNSDSDATSWVVGKSVGGADLFGWYYGSTRMVLDTSGNLGIGTSSPSYKLDVNSGSGGFSARIASTSTIAALLFNDSATTGLGPFVSSSGNNLIFGRAGVAEYMRITDAGNVGIGTSSPESGFRLHVVGNAFVQAASGTVSKTVVDNVDQRLVLGAYFETGVGQYSFISSTNNAETGNSPLLFNTGTTERMRIDSSGNVGIGTNNPGTYGKLEVVGSGYTATAVRSSDASGVVVALAANAADGARLNVLSNHPLQFFTNNTERMRIDTSSGNVGIGTSSPSNATLDVVGNANSISFAVRGRSSDNVGSIVFRSNNAGTEYAYFQSGPTFLTVGVNGAERMRIASDGIVTMSAYGAGAATFSAAGVISSVSDETWKTKDGAPVDPDAMLKKLEPGYWYYNDEKKETFGADRQLGFYAQNVNAAIGPEAAPEPEEGKPWGYYDRSVLAVVVMSLQKALATIESLEARIATLESKP